MTENKPVIPRKCAYGLPGCTSLSREHVISGAVLRAVFGDPVRNLASGAPIGNKSLLDHEQVLRDVCRRCNSALSKYDVAGVELVRALEPHHEALGISLPFDDAVFGWLLKTHLNFLRLIPDAETGKPYPIADEVKLPLVVGGPFAPERMALFIEGLQGKKYFWVDDHPSRIPWFDYRSLRFRSQAIVLSDLRLKCLDTWLLLPADGDYTHFEQRVDSVLDEAQRDYLCDPQRIDLQTALGDRLVRVQKSMPFRSVKKILVQRKITPAPRRR